MKDIDHCNEYRMENLWETADQAIDDGDWPVAREYIKLLEDMRVETNELRRRMNQAMAETDDITIVPIEQEVPFETAKEKAERESCLPKNHGDSYGNYENEQQNLTMIARQSNA